jgi:hypothetical protein
VYSDQGGRFESPTGFFIRFTLDRINQALAFFQVAGWLIDQERTGYFFFDQEELFIPFDDRGDRYMGFPSHDEFA